jgi:taurine dioxygenase
VIRGNRGIPGGCYFVSVNGAITTRQGIGERIEHLKKRLPSRTLLILYNSSRGLSLRLYQSAPTIYGQNTVLDQQAKQTPSTNPSSNGWNGPDGLHADPLMPFGVRIEGDFSRSLSPEGKCFLVAQVDAHGIVVAPKQHLTLEQQRKVLEPFGRVLLKDLDYVTPDDGILNNDGLAYHSDFAFAHTPYKNLSLHALEVVEGETCTRFANSALAYTRLSAQRRKHLAALTTTAIYTRGITRTVGYDLPPRFYGSQRAAVIFHHRTARPILYVSEAQTARFNELARTESDALLTELFDILYAPEAILEHSWCVGDLLIWDNLILQHGRPEFKSVTTRRLQRVSVADVGGDEMIPNFIVQPVE